MAIDVGNVGALTRHVVRPSFGNGRHVCGSNKGRNVQFLVGVIEIEHVIGKSMVES